MPQSEPAYMQRGEWASVQFSNTPDAFATYRCYLKALPGVVDRFTFWWSWHFSGRSGTFDSARLCALLRAHVNRDFEIGVALGLVVFTIHEFGFFIDKIVSEMKIKGRSVT
jgi:hypothetical protein